MSAVIFNGSPVSVAPGGVSRPRFDMVDRSRALDGTYRASVTGYPKRDFLFTTPPVPRSTADFYEWLFRNPTAVPCSGDLIGGSQNLALQSENFGTTWAALGTPTRTPAFATANGITFDLIGDDSAAAVEGYEQIIGFVGNAVKALSVHVGATGSSSVSSVFRIRDTTAAVDRLFGALTWSGGLPVLAMSAGAFLGYDVIQSGIFRLRFATASLLSGNVNQLGIYPATTAALALANMGALVIGGVQAEDAAIPSAYAKTTTAAVSTITINCCPEITGWVPVKTPSGHLVSLSFTLHEV